MTNLDRPVTRETRAIDTTRSGNRPLIVMLEAGGRIVRIRPKGTKRWYSVPYEAIYTLAIHTKAQESP